MEDRIKPKIKIGDKIKIIEMKDEPHYNGKVGIVKVIDDAGQLHGSWGGLAVNLNLDNIIIIDNDIKKGKK